MKQIYDTYRIEKQDEQASLQNNKNIDLTKILKDCPKGWKFYSNKYGEVTFWGFSDLVYPIQINTKNNGAKLLSEKGEEIIGNGKCILFPSKDQRDWNKFIAPWYKEDKLIKPKFKVGDWIISSVLGIAHIVCVNDFNEYQLEYIDGKQKFSSINYVNYKYDKWTINDAKDGDVLALSWLENKNLFEKIIIFKKYHSEGIKGLYSMPCVEGYGNTFKNGKMAFSDKEVPYYSKTWTCNLHPATKEQRNLLFQKMKDTGYEWDIKKKELKKLVPNRFDPKTLKLFDKVLVRDNHSQNWTCSFFSYIIVLDDGDKYNVGGILYDMCIPYNDDTEHLVGTTNEAPEYYRYWEN